MNKLIITFGTAHTHKVGLVTFGYRDAAVIYCSDYDEGLRIARAIFDLKYAFSYKEELPESMQMNTRLHCLITALKDRIDIYLQGTNDSN